MKFAGIDVAKDAHVLATVDERGGNVVTNFSFREDAEGHKRALERLGQPGDVLIVLEATGHYWVNLYAALTGAGHKVAVINALQSRRFAESELRRAKTDDIDARSLANFAMQKRPEPTVVPTEQLQDLRELVRFLDLQKQALGDTVRRLWRLMDLCFTGIQQIFADISGENALAVLEAYPTAARMRTAPLRKVAGLRAGQKKTKIGEELATQLIKTARESVASKKGPAYETQIGCLCEDIRTIKRRISDIEKSLDEEMKNDELGKLLLSIEGVGTQTTARLLGELGDPAKFKDAGSLASYVGVVPATTQSGRSRAIGKSISPIGHSGLRSSLWMPTLAAVRNETSWLGRYYRRLKKRGKEPKVALIACMRKLLIAVHWVATNRQPFVDHAAVAVPALESAT